MSMPPLLRKLALTVHVSVSVAWIGAVVSFLILSIAGLLSREAEIVRAAYLAMSLIGEYAIIPLSFGALLTGLTQALGTPWGLFRYYWIAVKLALTIGATLLLVLHQFVAVRDAARRIATALPMAMPDVGVWGTQLMADSAAAVAALLVITAIAVFKPWGLTPYGRRKRATAATTTTPQTAPAIPRSLKLALSTFAILLVVFLALHVARDGMHHGH